MEHDNLEPILGMMAKDTHEKLSEVNLNLENNVQQGAAIQREVRDVGETSKKILEEISKPKENGPVEIKIPGVETITLKGEKGDKGDRGEKGEKGDTGAQGPQGEKGADSTVPGPKGDIGPQGEQGPQGEAKTGERGPMGERGERGEKGEDGSPDTGAQIISKIKAVKEGRLSTDDIDGMGLYRRKGDRNDTGFLRELSDVAIGPAEPTNGYALLWNSTTKKWTPGAVAASSSGAGGLDTQVQYNDGGSLAGDAGMTWNKTSKTLTVTGSTSDASTLNQAWKNSGNTTVAYVASNGDAFFKYISIGDWSASTGVIKVTAGVLAPGQVNLASASDVTGLLPLANLTAGSDGDLLTTTSGAPAWASPSSLLNGLYIRLDGTTTTSAVIPFAQGALIADTKNLYFGNSGSEIGTISSDAANGRLNILGLDNPADGSGVKVRVFGGDGSVPDAPGGMVYIKGGAFGLGGDTFQNGFVAVGSTTTGFSYSNNISGASSVGNSQNDFQVEGSLYVSAAGIFASGIGLNGKMCPANYLFLGTGDTAQTMGLDRRSTTAAGVSLTIQAGWARFNQSNLNGGDLILAPGKATGSGSGGVQIRAVGGGGSATTDRTPSTVATFGISTLTLVDAFNIVVNTTTGTKIGTGTTQKLGFYNATPIVQPGATTDLGTVLSNLGFRAAGTAYPITTSGAVSLTGTIGLGGQVTVTDAINFALGTTTGTKFGTSTTQKIGFFNATPVVRPGNYSITNVTTDRTYDANATTTDELADVLGTLIADLQSLGLIG